MELGHLLTLAAVVGLALTLPPQARADPDPGPVPVEVEVEARESGQGTAAEVGDKWEPDWSSPSFDASGTTNAGASSPDPAYIDAPLPPPAPIVPAPEPAPPLKPAPRVTTTLSVFSYQFDEGHSAGAGLLTEIGRWGLRLGLSTLSWKDYRASESCRAAIFEARLALSLLARERVRLRLEGGVFGHVTSHAATLGPDSGLSANWRLFGPVGLESAAYLSPFPRVRLDSRVGVTLKFGPVILAGGARNVWMFRRMSVEPVGEGPPFAGPYLGVSFAL